MGMDGIEFSMDLEDAFGIEIPDRDVVDFETVGQWHETKRGTSLLIERQKGGHPSLLKSPDVIVILFLMPRTARNLADNCVYHLLNRGNCRMKIFTKTGDFAAFVRLVEQARRRFPTVRILENKRGTSLLIEIP